MSTSGLDLCIYHGDCIDGFTAAWAVWRKFRVDVTPPVALAASAFTYGQPRQWRCDVEFHAARYGTEPPDVTGKRVLLVDFCYPRETLLRMAEESQSLLILDHHKTAEADLKDLPYAVFDMTRSGAGMAWDHFHAGEVRPWLINYVEDRDLWLWLRVNSKLVNACIHSWPRSSFESWDALAQLHLTAEVMVIGRGAQLNADNYLREMRGLAAPADFAGWADVPVINCPFINVSDLLVMLASESKPGLALGWYKRADGQYQYSLRSTSGIDVSAIAKLYGGGGHAAAAGFILGYLIPAAFYTVPRPGSEE